MIYRSIATTLLALSLLATLPTNVRAASGDISNVTLFRMLDATPQLKRNTKVAALGAWRYYDVRDTNAAGYVNPELETYGYLASGADVLIVPLISGGSGGVFYTLLYTRLRSKPTFIGYVPSKTGHLDVSIHEGKLLVTTPIYRGNDANCCHSAKHDMTYALDGISLRLLSKRTSAFPQPPR